MPDEGHWKEDIPPPRPRHTRRLYDKVLQLVHQSLDQGRIEVAQDLLVVCERILREPPPLVERRKDQETLVAAYERLWSLNSDSRG